MNEQIKALWAKALKSGNYKQGKDALRNEKNEFCCLGVLCDIHHKETGLIGWIEQPGEDKEVHYVYDGRSGILPESVQKWAGIDTSTPVVEKKGERLGVIGLNDTGVPFAKIAELIEASL